MTTHAQTVAIVAGEKPPAMSVSWEPPAGPCDSGYVVFFSDLPSGDPGFDELPAGTVCLECLVEDGDEQLGRGLDLARQLGQVDWDDEAEEWFVPDDAQVPWRGEA